MLKLDFDNAGRESRISRRVCDDMRRMIVNDIDSCLTLKEVMERLRVSYQVISELRKTHAAFSIVQFTPGISKGPLPKNHTQAEEGCSTFLSKTRR